MVATGTLKGLEVSETKTRTKGKGEFKSWREMSCGVGVWIDIR